MSENIEEKNTQNITEQNELQDSNLVGSIAEIFGESEDDEIASSNSNQEEFVKDDESDGN